MTKEIYLITSNKAPTEKEMEYLGETIMWEKDDAIFNIEYKKKSINLENMEEKYTYYITIYAKNKIECERLLDAQIYDGVFENWKVKEDIRLIVRKTI